MNSPLFPNKRALIIGGGGFIGGSIAQALLAEKNWDVHTYDRKSINIKGITAHLGDLKDRDSIKKALQDCDCVFYMASHSVPATSPAELNHEIQTTLTFLNTVLELMAEKKTPRIVFASSGGTVYGASETPNKETDSLNPLSSYGMGKMLSEQLIQFYSRLKGTEYYICRLANVYGCTEKRDIKQGLIEIILSKLKTNQTLDIWGTQDPVRDYIHIDDVCAAILELFRTESPSGVYNIGTGHGQKMSDVIKTIEDLTQSKVQINRLENQSGGLKYSVLDTTKISKSTQWKPQLTLSAGIKKLIESYKN